MRAAIIAVGDLDSLPSEVQAVTNASSSVGLQWQQSTAPAMRCGRSISMRWSTWQA